MRSRTGARAPEALRASRIHLAIAVALGWTAGAAACSSSGGSNDAPPAEAGANDDTHVEPGDATSDAAPAPRLRDHLSQTGLYADIRTKTLSPDAIEFQPRYPLWSDGAVKRRWMRLPKGTTIDASDPDHWKLPVGGQLFKEFVRDGTLVETRLVERVGDTGVAEKDYWLGAFVWRDDESDADFTLKTQNDVRGTAHDVPGQEVCWSCHNGEPGHVLGLSAIQLSHSLGGMNLAGLRAQGLVPATIADQPLTGDPLAVAAGGYLHANCGHCHNVNGAAWAKSNMTLRLAYGATDVPTSALYKTTVGVAVQSYANRGYDFRIDPGSPATSAIVHRMDARDADGGTQMPPIATELVHAEGVQQVSDWVASLPPRDAGAD
jgi:hypothetical protein